MVSKVRIEDVAEAAGVSMKTVSRVLNREPNVRDATRELVMNAVRKLRYVPNFSARSLAGNRSYLIALVYNNPSPNYLMEIMGGVLEACVASQYNMVLCPSDTDGPRLLADIDALMARSRPDGLKLTPPITESRKLIAHLELTGVPFASVSPKQQVGRSGVAMDETQAAFDMVRHLAGLGLDDGLLAFGGGADQAGLLLPFRTDALGFLQTGRAHPVVDAFGDFGGQVSLAHAHVDDVDPVFRKTVVHAGADAAHQLGALAGDDFRNRHITQNCADCRNRLAIERSLEVDSRDACPARLPGRFDPQRHQCTDGTPQRSD